jgi:hypothetical protein
MFSSNNKIYFHFHNYIVSNEIGCASREINICSYRTEICFDEKYIDLKLHVILQWSGMKNVYLLLAPAHLHASIHVAALDESHFLEDQQ